MEAHSIQELDPFERTEGRKIVLVNGTVWRYSFGPAQMVKKQLSFCFFWNTRIDPVNARRAGDERTLLEIIEHAVHPRTPADDILPSLEHAPSNYIGWNGDRFFFYKPDTHKAKEIALHVREVQARPARKSVLTRAR